MCSRRTRDTRRVTSGQCIGKSIDTPYHPSVLPFPRPCAEFVGNKGTLMRTDKHSGRGMITWAVVDERTPRPVYGAILFVSCTHRPIKAYVLLCPFGVQTLVHSWSEHRCWRCGPSRRYSRFVWTGLEGVVAGKRWEYNHGYRERERKPGGGERTFI